MTLGTITVKKFGTDEILFISGITGFTQTGGRMYADIDTGYQSSLPILRGNVYSVTVTIDNSESPMTISNTASFEDYMFNAGASDYVDAEGVHHAGIVVLSNRLQFLLMY
mgnify:CR=1 FL=1